MRGLFFAGGLLVLITTLGARGAAAQTLPPDDRAAREPRPWAPAEPVPLRNDAAPPLVLFPGVPVPPPMWPEEVLPPQGARPVHHDEGMRVAGIIVSTLGMALSILGVGLFFGDDTSGAGAIVLPVGGLVLPAIGIPLWVSGSRPWKSWDPIESSSSRLPAVTAGARTATLGWAF